MTTAHPSGAGLRLTAQGTKCATTDIAKRVRLHLKHLRHADMTETAPEAKDAREDTVLLITVHHKHADMMETV